VEPKGLKIVLNKVLRNSVDEQTIDRFIRFLDKDKSGKIPYMDFIQRMAEVSNRDHNPFKSVVQRLAYFLESNKQSIKVLLKRLSVKDSSERTDALSPTTENGTSISTFT
jgi:Ca2+-binding EF-hand superfamily protein